MVSEQEEIEMAKRPGMKCSDFGKDSRRDVLIRMPSKRYELLGKLAFREWTSISYQMNEALALILVRAGLERETK